MYQAVRPCLARPSRVGRAFSTTSTLHGYADTLSNLRIGSHTRVIFQGFTGKQATADAKDSLEWGTKIVGGVTPGRTGEHLGLPVLPTVRQVCLPQPPSVYRPPSTVYLPSTVPTGIPMANFWYILGHGGAQTRCHSHLCVCSPCIIGDRGSYCSRSASHSCCRRAHSPA